MKTFDELGLSERILKAIHEMGYEMPMPVQEEVIPYLLGDHNDIVALAQTGTGKTAAYGLPLLERLDIERLEPQALVLCPTRELCLQIAADLSDYSKYMDDVKVLPVYGGSSIESQIRALKRGVHIIVATPGRLIDLMNRKVVMLDTASTIVLDEADEMLSMGFSEDLNTILAALPEKRSTLLFSATMSDEIAKISKSYLHDAKEVTIGGRNEGTRNVSHIAYFVQAKDKYLALKRIVDYYPKIYGIIFCRTRMETQEIADKLIQDGYNADALHGDLSQQQRDLTMQKFRQRRTQLLVATDVAARGLDVDDLTHVINYGLPDDLEVYNHRSGRTGRADKKGKSIAILHVREKGSMKDIEKMLNQKFEICSLPSGEEICEKQLFKAIDDIERVEVIEEQIEKFLPTVYRKLDWLSKEDLIKRMLSMEFNRFAQYYANAPEIKTPSLRSADSDDKKPRRKDRKDRAGGPRQAEAGYTRLFVTAGKMDSINPAKLMDILNRRTHRRIDVGRIDIMPKFSFFEVKEKDTSAVIEAMAGAKLGERTIQIEVADLGDVENPQPKARKDKKAQKEPAEPRNRAERRLAEGKGAKKDKPSRAERGYTAKRGPKGKDDWKKFFDPEFKLKGEIPDFEEEGWARRKR